jgi:hypothetical protein
MVTNQTRDNHYKKLGIKLSLCDCRLCASESDQYDGKHSSSTIAEHKRDHVIPAPAPALPFPAPALPFPAPAPAPPFPDPALPAPIAPVDVAHAVPAPDVAPVARVHEVGDVAEIEGSDQDEQGHIVDFPRREVVEIEEVGEDEEAEGGEDSEEEKEENEEEEKEEGKDDGAGGEDIEMKEAKEEKVQEKSSWNPQRIYNNCSPALDVSTFTLLTIEAISRFKLSKECTDFFLNIIRGVVPQPACIPDADGLKKETDKLSASPDPIKYALDAFLSFSHLLSSPFYSSDSLPLIIFLFVLFS